MRRRGTSRTTSGCAAATKATGEAGAGAGSGSGSGAGSGAGAGIGEPAKNGADGDGASPFSIQEHLNAKMVLWGGDLCSLNTEAIVNTTNEALRDRTGISGQIFRRAGPDLVAEIQSTLEEGCRTGSAVVTSGCNLPAKHIIHTVGPRYNEKYRQAAENALHGCYRGSMQHLIELKLNTVAFPCLYTMNKHYPREEAAHVALRTIRRFLEV